MGLVQLWSPAQHLPVRTRLPVLYLTPPPPPPPSLLPLFMNVQREAALYEQANVDDAVIQSAAVKGRGGGV